MPRVPAAIEVTGSWEVHFAEGWGAPASKTFPRLMSWTEDADPGVKYFSGIAKYLKTFRHSRRASWPRLAAVSRPGRGAEDCPCQAQRRGAGHLLDHAHSGSRSRQRPRPGANRLEIEVANTWSNRITGDLLSSDSTKFTHTNIRWDKKTPLLPSGLLGPVRVVPARQAEVRLG